MAAEPNVATNRLAQEALNKLEGFGIGITKIYDEAAYPKRVWSCMKREPH